MNKVKRCWHNILKILRLQLKVSRKNIVLEVLSALFEKVKVLLEIALPAVVIELFVSERHWKAAVLAIIFFSALIALLDFAYKRAKESLSAHASRMDNRIALNINKKSLSVDYKDTLLSESLDQREKAESAIAEFLEIDYILFSRLFGALISLAALGYLFVQLDILAFLLVIAVAILHYLFAKKIIKIEHVYELEKSDIIKKQKYIEELLFDIRYGKDIRVYEAADYITQKYMRISSETVNIEEKKRKHMLKIQRIDRLLQMVQMLSIYLFAILKYIAGTLTIGYFTMYLRAANEISGAVSEIFDTIAEVSRVNVYFDDYERYMQLPEKIRSSGTCENTEICLPLTIEFRNVSFRYPNSDTDALQNVSFQVSSSQTISVVGENGAGKTTLMYLLMRLFDVSEGAIYLNGINIKEYPYDIYAKIISPVFQDYTPLSYSIRENVVFDGPLDRDKLQECYAKADLLGKIHALKNGDNTILTKDLSEEGEDLSGGEKQKLALARAYYHGGDILILDEPTAAIDPISEYHIYKNIAESNIGKITFFISHRMTSSMFSDHILVLDKGRLVTQGKHEALMKESPLYSEMFHKQACYYRK